MLLSSRDLAQVPFGTGLLLLTEVEMLLGRPVCTVIFTRLTEASTDLAVSISEQETNFKSFILVLKYLLCLFLALCASASNARPVEFPSPTFWGSTVPHAPPLPWQSWSWQSAYAPL